MAGRRAINAWKGRRLFLEDLHGVRAARIPCPQIRLTALGPKRLGPNERRRCSQLFIIIVELFQPAVGTGFDLVSNLRGFFLTGWPSLLVSGVSIAGGFLTSSFRGFLRDA